MSDAAPRTLCLILARAGSKGLPNKNVLPLHGKPMIAWTIDFARQANVDMDIVVSTDGDAIADVAREHLVKVVSRPAELASDKATVDAAARHAVETVEQSDDVRYDPVVILYGNVPIRPAGLIDDALDLLHRSGADSVQSVAPVGKMHPYWMKKLTGTNGDVLEPFIANKVYRRQELPDVYMLDGGIIAVRRASLFLEDAAEPHAFLGHDRRALVTEAGRVVDIDEQKDLQVAEAVLAATRISAAAGATISVAGRRIGFDQPVYVIAELGVNHDGDEAKALQLVDAAADAGADAVKVQVFDPELLLSANAELAEYQTGETHPRSMLERLRLPLGALQRVRERARQRRLGFVATCFSIELIDDMRALEVDAAKVASPDCINLPLVEALTGLDVPLLVSLGTATPDELGVLDDMVRLCRHVPLVLMQCVSAYPTPRGESGIDMIATVASRFGVVPGYSDHTDDAMIGALAIAAGARVLEKHLTYDRAARGPDHAASFDPRQFARYVSLARQADAEMIRRATATDVEADVRRVSRQSICAVRDLPVGHVIVREDVTVKRPGDGIPAARLAQVVGKRLFRAVRTNHLIYPGDIDL